MTGVIEGSGGTGVLEGHRPGTGVEGGGGMLVPSSIGNFAETSGYLTSWETPSMTVPIGEAVFLVFVQSTCGIDQPANVYTCSGLGLEWTRIVYDYYDSSTSGSDRSSQALFYGRGVAADGTLTFTKDLYAKLAVSVIEVENAQIATSGWAFASTAGVTDLTVPAITDPLPATVLIAGNQRFDDSQREPVLEADWTELGWTGWATFNAAVKTAYVSNDVDTTFDIATDAGNQGGIVIGLTSLAPTYLAIMNDRIGPNARYEGFPIAPAAAPQPYVDELADMTAPPNTRYPGFPIGTGAPLGTYNDILAADDPSTLVYPGAKGTTTDPIPAYDPTAEGLDTSTYIEPGPKGTISDPFSAYDTILAGTSMVRRYAMDQINAAAPLDSYDDQITTTTPVRFMPLDQLNTLEGEILALAPVSYWRLNANTAGAVTDQGSLANNASAVGGVTWADELGPDGQLYPTFNGTTGYLSAPDQNEYSIDTVAGSTFLVTFKPTAWTDTPLLLGKFAVADNEWFIKFSSTGDGQGLVAQVYNTGQAFAFVSAEIDGDSASLDAWHTLVVTFPPGDTIPRLFLNSATAQVTTDVGPSGTREPDSTGPLTIGGSTSAAGFFTGAIGHVAVWDTELAGAAITDLIAAAAAEGWAQPELPRVLRNLEPAGYWKLDDSDDTVVDSSGNAHNGTANFASSPAELAGPDGRFYRTFDADPGGDYRGLVEIAHNGESEFSFSGAFEEFVVPAGVTTITVDAYGASGGFGNASVRGLGGRVTCDIAVTPGETLRVYVGGQGDNGALGWAGAGGWNGGAQGGWTTGFIGGGGGGGATDIRESPFALEDRLVVAPGGGGGGFHTSDPGGGGTPTGLDDSNATYGGKGGTSVAGGAAGAGSGNSGALGVGGAGDPLWSGGGAAGLYGGGGGGGTSGSRVGGGGGSGLSTGVGETITNATRTGNGSALLTWPEENTDYDPAGHGLTVVALIYTDVADLMYPIVKRPPVNQFTESGWQIDHSSTDWRSSILDTGGSTFRESTDAASVATAEWQLVIVRQGDQAAANNEIELFIDSDTVTSTQNIGGSGTYASNPNAPLFLGGHPWTAFYGLNGAMAHVAVYPRELSDLEVQAVHAAAIADGWIPAS